MQRLLASIHDVGPRFEGEVARLYDAVTSAIGSRKVAMLVVPDHWDEAPLSANPRFAAKLRGWADAGAEIFLHGWRHRDDAPRGFRQRHMTAGEGEFAALDQPAAAALLARGRTVVEDAIGRPVAGFVAPAWLYSDGARAAVRVEGFALAEDHLRVWQPTDGAVLARGPVVTWASRSAPRIASSLAVAAVARSPLWRFDTVRVAVHPGDTNVPALMQSIDRTLRHFAVTHVPSSYAALACAS